VDRRNLLKGVSGALLGAFVAGPIVTGCSQPGGGSGGGGEGDEDLLLRMSWFGGPERAEAMNASLDLFEENHPNVTVEREEAQFAPYNEKLAAQSAAGDAPDLISTGTESLTIYKDLLIDLNEHRDKLDLSGFTEADLGLTTVDGALIALPVSYTVSGVLVNKTLFDGAGLELPDFETWSWDEMLEVAKEMTAKTPDNVYGLSSFGFNQLYFMFNIGLQNGETPYGSDGKLTLSDESLTQYFELLEKATEMGACPPADVAIEAAQNASTTEVRYALSQANAGGVGGELSRSDPGTELFMTAPPGGDPKSVYYTAGISWGVTNQSDHVDDALGLLNYLITDQEAVNVRGTALQIPLNSNVAEGVIDAIEDPQLVAAMNWARTIKETGTELASPHRAWGSFANVLAQASTDLLQGRTTPAEAATQFASEMNRLVEQTG